MERYEFRPVKCKHNNANYTLEGCFDLPVTKGKDGIKYSVWRLKSFKERLKFLFKGTITLYIKSPWVPPTGVSNGDILNVNGLWD